MADGISVVEGTVAECYVCLGDEGGDDEKARQAMEVAAAGEAKVCPQHMEQLEGWALYSADPVYLAEIAALIAQPEEVRGAPLAQQKDGEA